MPGPGLPPVLARSAPAAAAWTGFGAAALGAFVTVAIALALWIPDPAATGTSGATVRGGLLTFLAAQHGGVRLSGVAIGFVPLGLTMLAVGLCWRSARVLWALPVVERDRRSARLAALAGVQITTYALTCTALAPFSIVGTSRVTVLGAAVGSVGVGLAGFGAAALVMTPLGLRAWSWLPALARVAVRAGSAALAVYVTGGALLAAAATVARSGRFVDLSRGLGTGISGLPVAALDVSAAPNAVVAAMAYLVGPGFAVGRHATYSLLGSHPGPVPAFPILAGLPTTAAPSPLVLGLTALTVLGAGTLAGLVVRRGSRRTGWVTMLAAAGSSGLVAGGLLAVTSALAGGSMGAHQLRAVGASPWRMAAVGAVEVGVIAMLVSTIVRLFVRSERPLSPAEARLETRLSARPDTPAGPADPGSDPGGSVPASVSETDPVAADFPTSELSTSELSTSELSTSELSTSELSTSELSTTELSTTELPTSEQSTTS